MEKPRHSKEIKDKVEKLRCEGKTYKEIQKIFPIPKSTLSQWLGEKYGDMFDAKEHLRRIRKLSAAKLSQERLAREAIYAGRGIEAVKKLSLHNIEIQKALLAMLYWAEGSKYDKVCALKFVNTDPLLAHLYITLLRNCFAIDERKFRVRLHLHAYHNKQKAIKFWSELLQVSPKQFGKLYIKPLSKTKKFRQNFMGICFIAYHSAALWKEVMTIGPAIAHAVLVHQKSSPR